MQFKEAPLDEMLELPVHEMNDTQLLEFIREMDRMRMSAQTRKAKMKAEATDLGVEKKKGKKQSDLEKALALLG